MQGWHSVCPSVEHRVPDISGRPSAAGIAHDPVRRSLGVGLAAVGETTCSAHADAAGDGLADMTGFYENNDAFHSVSSLICGGLGFFRRALARVTLVARLFNGQAAVRCQNRRHFVDWTHGA